MFGFPDQRQLFQAMNQNPSQAAAAGLASAQGQQAPGRRGAQTPPPSQGFATQVGANQRNTGQVPSGGPASPGQFGTGNFAYNSPNWYGQSNEYGTSVMGSSPGAFWGGYAEDVMGLQPGSNAGAFLANKYNPFAMGNVMYGKGFVSDDERLAGATSIANQIAGPGTTFFDPGVLIGQTLQALMSGDAQSLAQQNPQLAALITGNIGNPAGQVDSLLGFFQDLLSATMPPDVLSAFISQLQMLGQVWFSQMRKGDIQNLDASTFAQFLTSQLGPTLGL